MNIQDLIALAKTKAVEHEFDPALVCAICDHESGGWNPWAIRYEPGFYEHYVAPIAGLSPTEAHARAFSWGLMQLMGQAAREHGFANTYLASLLDPETNLEWGLRHLRLKFNQGGNDTHKALLLWNGGGDPYYPDKVLPLMAKYNLV